MHRHHREKETLTTNIIHYGTIGSLLHQERDFALLLVCPLHADAQPTEAPVAAARRSALHLLRFADPSPAKFPEEASAAICARHIDDATDPHSHAKRDRRTHHIYSDRHHHHLRHMHRSPDVNLRRYTDTGTTDDNGMP